MKNKSTFSIMRRVINLTGTIGLAVLLTAAGAGSPAAAWALTYPIVDTGQNQCYDEYGRTIPCGGSGQDGQYQGNQPAYRDNGDGTITDLVTGLMWQRNPGQKLTYAEAAAGAFKCRTARYSDWRLPTIKELYSLINFSGKTGRSAQDSKPYLDTRFFDFLYGDVTGERFIDSQYASSTLYVGRTMRGNPTMFGVNFADGRIKGYPYDALGPRGAKKFYVMYVRGGNGYGVNQFVDNGDGTITDKATGLMWMKVDSGALKAGRDQDGLMNWPQALWWAKNMKYAGHSDWRLPNAKELQSIVNYTRAPAVTGSPAIDPVFQSTPIKDPEGQTNFAYYWTGTTHLDGPRLGDRAVYVAFGEAQGWMSIPPDGPGGPGGPGGDMRPGQPPRRPRGMGPPPRPMDGFDIQGVGGPGGGLRPGEPPHAPGSMDGRMELMDVHGAGAQRSDLKAGDPSLIPKGMGPQGDVQSIYNMVRLVRSAN